MPKFLLTVFLLLIAVGAFAQSSSNIIKPKVWLRADAGNRTPLLWTDISGGNHNATALAGEGPIDSTTINFNNAVRFDGTDYMKVPYSLERTSELAVLSVFQSADTTERGMWGVEEAVTRNIMLTTRNVYGPDTIADYYGKQENRAILNTLVQNWDKTVVTDSSAYLALGSTGKTKNHKPFIGAFAELLIFDRALTFLERIQYETYLSIKYGASLKNQNYVSLDNRVLWNASQNQGYSERLAGIGRDDAFQLYQKQSGSVYDSGFLTISVERLATSNRENRATINQGDFLVWGDNNMTRADKPGNGVDSILSVVERKWLITATGNTARQIPTEVYVDMKKLAPNPEGYWLIIDRSGQGNFSVDNVEYIIADRITSDNKAVYKVVWDTDQSGKDNFSFAKARGLFVVVHTLKSPSCTNETAGKVRIQVIVGKPAYQFKLSSSTKILSEWNSNGNPIEQDGLKKDTYKLLVTAKNGEVLTRNFVLNMPDALHIDAGQDQRLPPSKEIVLDIKDQVPDSILVTYRWQNNFGFTSEGSKVTITESGIYQVEVTKKKDGCVFSDEVMITGTEEQKLAVYPTVISKGETYHVSVSLPEPAAISVLIYDLKGNVYQEWTGSDKTEYHFKGSLGSSGMYLVRLHTPKGPKTAKLIVN